MRQVDPRSLGFLELLSVFIHDFTLVPVRSRQILARNRKTARKRHARHTEDAQVAEKGSIGAKELQMRHPKKTQDQSRIIWISLFGLMLLESSLSIGAEESDRRENRRRQSRVIHLKPAPFNGRLSLLDAAPVESTSWQRQGKQLNASSNEPDPETHIAASSPMLELRPSSGQSGRMGSISGDFKGLEGSRHSSGELTSEWLEPETRLVASESVSTNVKGLEQVEREQQATESGGDSAILSLVDDFDSTIATNRTKGEFRVQSLGDI